MFYTNISSCVLNNGWSSNVFNLGRGVRQEFPLSPYLFILYAEILGNTVRKDNEVRGIKIFDTECQLSRYADDSTMILDDSKSSFLRSRFERRRFPLFIRSVLNLRRFLIFLIK